MLVRIQKSFGALAFLGMLVAANLGLGQHGIARACLGGPGYGGIYDGPWYLSDCTADEFCEEAECNCGSGNDFWDDGCTPLRLCAGSCIPAPETH